MNDEVVEDAGLMDKGYLYVSLGLQSVLRMVTTLFCLVPNSPG